MPTISIGSSTITFTGGLLTLPIIADPIVVTSEVSAGSSVTGTPINPLNNTIFNCAFKNQGIIFLTSEITGGSLNNNILASPIVVTSEVTGGGIAGNVSNGTISLTATVFGRVYASVTQINFVAWSKIGEATTVIDRTNQAGYAPMEWPGWAFVAKQLEDMIVVYGDNGITLMYPVNDPIPTFGFRTISRVGLLGSRSVAGTDFMHYFITSLGDLWKITKKGPELLGFKEFLHPLASPVLSYDELEDRLFIADGVTGYVYDDGLGGGYATLSSVSAGLYGSADTLAGIPCSIMTDTVDLGHRGIKLVTFVELGTDSTENLYVAVDFRYSKAETWRTSAWAVVNPEGVAFVNVAGVEFRIRIKQTVYDEIRLDYINVRHKRTDKRFLRGPLYEQPDTGEQR